MSSLILASSSAIFFDEIKPKSNNWLLNCLPCQSIIAECSSKCVVDECFECVSQVTDSQCASCADEMVKDLATREKFYCDNSVLFEREVCKLACRSKNVIPFFRDGICDAATGICICQ